MLTLSVRFDAKNFNIIRRHYINFFEVRYIPKGRVCHISAFIQLLAAIFPFEHNMDGKFYEKY